jgi:hypothetical protein
MLHQFIDGLGKLVLGQLSIAIGIERSEQIGSSERWRSKPAGSVGR